MHDMAYVRESTPSDMLRECACQRTRATSRAITRLYDDALRPSGLRATQAAVLAAIASEQADSIASLARILGMDRSTLTRALDPLLQEKLVTASAEGWRRSRRLAVTAAGTAVLASALPLWAQAQASMRRRMGELSWDEAMHGLDVIGRAASTP